MAIELKPQKHLTNILKTTNNPNFTLFLGAGASVTSGVKSAGELIKEWRSAYSEMHSLEKLKKQSWHDKPIEYSELFEALYDQPSQRRDFIENCIKDATPSWGYIYLANLLKNNIFNTVFTTNFDDLINEACYTFTSDLKPIVSAHDSSIKSVRLTSPRPKIIKLHGDFLFDNIKNTVRELESLEDNMRSKFRQYASEFGMIFVGYAGNDRSIMDTLNTLLHSEANFPHGIYWCVRKGTDLSSLPSDLENLARFPRFHIVEIEGFDEFMAEVHHNIGIQLQDEVSNPYSSLADRLNKIFDSRLDESDELENEESNYHNNTYINNDMVRLSENLQNYHSATSLINRLGELMKENESGGGERLKEAIEQLLQDTQVTKSDFFGNLHVFSAPNILLADAALRNKDYDLALNYAMMALDKKNSAEAISIAIKSISGMGCSDNLEALDKLIVHLKDLSNLTNKDVGRLMTAAVDLISAKEYSKTQTIFETLKSNNTNINDRTAHLLDLNIALCIKLSQQSLPEQLKSRLQSNLNNVISNTDYWVMFGLAIFLNKEDLVEEAAKNLKEDYLIDLLMKNQPIMKLVPNPLFSKIIRIAEDRGIEYLDEDSEEVNEITTESENYGKVESDEHSNAVVEKDSEGAPGIQQPKNKANGKEKPENTSQQPEA
ncbi:SIR2 family protein [Photobacterium sp. WH77]|uniref:SIR2 family protein n=1 Tax=unclassified Photobacterium TaxID=2628852 RepID=UPI001EDBC696|nr:MULTISPECIES: SIR2 family protein [unclassified Photobacterium]MCG2837690.1 SIR2 family protein [Photobacterium sp. WH77]MCG2845306.1 SIR2 family protein [Photobacterium sp. WH80]